MLVCPNRILGQQFTSTIQETKAFHVVADLQRYPNPRQLDARLRQTRPDVVLLDLSADTETAISLIQVIAAFRPTIHVIGLHESNDASVIIRSLRAGATEFLCHPFDLDSQSTVITRILRLRESEERTAPKRGQVLVFLGAKAGQGASTLAYHTAAVAAEDADRKVLLADLDLIGGTVSFVTRQHHSYGIVDAIRHAEKLDNALWSALVNSKHGLDLLFAPEKPELVAVEAHRMQEVVEYARSVYDVVVLDLPTPYERISQAALAEADKVLLVCNTELASLHLTRKAIAYLEQMGVGRERMLLVVNRMRRRSELSAADVEKVFNYPISSVLPEDYPTAHRALTVGKPIPPATDLGRNLRELARKLIAEPKTERKKGIGAALKFSALLSQG